MANVVCLVTGPIVGLQSTALLEETHQFAAAQGKRLFSFNLLDEVIAARGWQAGNAYERLVRIRELLDGYQYQFEDWRREAYRSIAMKICNLPKIANVIVRAPASIEWRGINVQFKDHHIIAETIQPDRIVTLIDAEWRIKENLATLYGKAALRLIVQREALGLAGILRWLGAEVSTSEDWSEWCRHLTKKPVRHFVLGVRCPRFRERRGFHNDVDNLLKAATAKVLPSFYVSYSMTVSTAAERAIINAAIEKLRRYGLVVDPGCIEIGKEVDPADESVVFAYTVARDLRWDVRKVDIVAAFHPYKSRPPLSTGMMDELGHARAFGKERYLVLPTGGGSPFTGGTYIPMNHLFTDVDQFFDFLKKSRRPTLKPVFESDVDAFDKLQATRRKKKKA